MSRTFFKSVKNAVKHWYVPLIIGILFIISGIFIFRTPLESYVSLSILFSSLFLVAGIMEVVFALTNKEEIDNWGWLLFSGILNFILGAVLLANPEVSMVVLPIYVGFGLMFRSIGAMSSAFELKNYGAQGWGGLLVMGILGLIFSTVMVWNPAFGGVTIVYWTGFALITLGFFSVYYAIQLKKLKNYSKNISSELKDRYEQIKKEIEDHFNQDRN